VVEFTPLDNITSYELQWKEHAAPQKWEDSSYTKTATINTTTSKTKQKCEATNLTPGTTYCVRLTTTTGDYCCSKELIIDTEQVGCTPKPKQGCGCVVS
jgi:hypothetical protein